MKLIDADAHIQPSPEKLPNTDWIANMTAEERLNLIAELCVDWDGYRTADGLGTLLNEIWAYAIYPVRTSRPTDEQREATPWNV